MQIHDLKCWPPYFEDFASGRKRAELRVNDRNYGEGDLLLLREYVPTARELEDNVGPEFDREELEIALAEFGQAGFTSRSQMARVTHVLRAGFGLRDDYVMLSLGRIELVPM